MDNVEENYDRFVNHFYTEVFLPWSVYNYMFSKQKHIDILNDYENSLFIYISQKCISDSIIFSINRLIEKRKNDSLTLHYFKSKMIGDSSKKRVGNMIESLKVDFEDYKIYRDKKLAHLDKDNKTIKYIGNDIEEIISEIIIILNFIKKENSFKKEIPSLKETTIFIDYGQRNTKEIIDKFIEDINFSIVRG